MRFLRLLRHLKFIIIAFCRTLAGRDVPQGFPIDYETIVEHRDYTATAFEQLKTEEPNLFDQRIRVIDPLCRFVLTEQAVVDNLHCERARVRRMEAVAHAHLSTAPPGVKVPVIANLDSARKRDQITTKAITILVAVGLATIHFVAICRIWEVDVTRVGAEDIPTVILAAAASTALLVGTQLGLPFIIKSTRSYALPDTFDLRPNLFPVPFFRDGAFWLSVLVVILEALFAWLPLIQGLPFQFEGNPLWQLTAFAIGCFAATVNILMGWGVALEEVRLELSHHLLQAQPDAFTHFLREPFTQLLEARALVEEIDHEIARRSALLAQFQAKACREYRRWEFAYRRYLFERRKT